MSDFTPRLFSMEEPRDDGRVLCRRCWGSGRADEQGCDACNGKGWLLSSEKQTGESGVNVGDNVVEIGGAARTKVSGGSTKYESTRQKTELERLYEYLNKVKRRIAILETGSPSRQVGAEEGSVDDRGSQVRRGPPATAEEFLDLLERSQLLDAERLQAARSLNDARSFAKRLVTAGVLTGWQATQLAAGRSSFLLGKHKLIRLLGGGNMGVVFLAEHVTMGRRVAIRVISRDLSSDSRLLERFLDEARTLAEVEHPNIIRAYNVDKSGEHYYLVMEYVDGHNLDKIVRSQGPLDYGLAADYVRQAAEGLHHGHENGFIHGNVKPSNLLVDRSGVVKIVDLGLSGLQESGRPGSSDNKHMLDSIDYLSPECAFGSMDIDRRADIYSLGCTLYFLLTGQPPFPKGLLSEKLMKHQSAEPESIRTFRADAPAALVEACGKMMAKKPEDRYETCLVVARHFAALK